jgi:hypothetical protein
VNRAFGVAFAVAVLTLSAAFAWTIGIRNRVELESRISYRPTQVRDEGYVSSETCRACHPSQYATWHDSYHRSMTQLATPDTVRADFDGVTVAAVKNGRPLRLERRGNEFWAEMDDPDWDGTGGAPPRITRQVVMITGSHHQQVYWYRTDNSRVIGQLPAMYLIADGRWIPRGAAFLSPSGGTWPSEEGRWNRVCVACHATHGKGLTSPPGWVPVESQVADTKVAEFGIACEACHGPSEEHVAKNRDPLRRYWLHLTGQPDPTTVQPQRLSPHLSSQVCGQCHAVWDFYDDEDHREANEEGLPFRPGDDLRKTRFVAQPSQDMQSPKMRELLLSSPSFVRDSFWADGMVRVSGREYNGLIDSPCFTDARDETQMMSCFSCHTLHKTDDDPRSVKEWADTHQVSPGMQGNEACLQCHSAFRANVTAHTKHQADSTGSSCYNCHMSYTTYGLLRAMRSHQISNPTVAASVETGRPNACNQCHLDKTLAWTSDYLEKWYGTPRAALDQDQQTIAASLLWLLRGDAGQRALAAWSMGWQPAQRASGTTWTAPYLSVLLNDPYDAVRFIAYRALRSQPGFAQFDYDFIAPPERRIADRFRAMDLWLSTRGAARRDPALLLDADGEPDGAAVIRLYEQRDDTLVNLVE